MRTRTVRYFRHHSETKKGGTRTQGCQGRPRSQPPFYSHPHHYKSYIRKNLFYNSCTLTSSVMFYYIYWPHYKQTFQILLKALWEADKHLAILLRFLHVAELLDTYQYDVKLCPYSKKRNFSSRCTQLQQHLDLQKIPQVMHHPESKPELNKHW